MGDMSREPSMEEILSSIRRVIARDDAAREAGLEARFGESAASADADDILELTEAAPDAPLAPDMSADRDSAEHAPQMTEPPVADSDELLSPDSAAAARQSLAQLDQALAGDGADAVAAPAAAAGLTVEALAEAALKPMLQQWLDAHLPAMVERLVAQEIARITGPRR